MTNRALLLVAACLLPAAAFVAGQADELVLSALPLRVGIPDPEKLFFFPMYYTESLSPAGFDISLVHTLLTRVGLDPTNETQVEFVNLPTLDARMTYLETGEVDLTLGALAVTEERKERVNFVHPYYYASGMVLAISKSDSDPERFSGGWGSIAGNTICVMSNAYYASTLSDYGAVLYYVEERGQLQQNIEDGNCIAAAVLSTDLQLSVRGMVRAEGLEPIDWAPYALAVSKNNPGLEIMLSGALVSMMKDGPNSDIFLLEQEFMNNKQEGCAGPDCEGGSFQPLQELQDSVRYVSDMFPGNWTVTYPDPALVE